MTIWITSARTSYGYDPVIVSGLSCDSGIAASLFGVCAARNAAGATRKIRRFSPRRLRQSAALASVKVSWSQCLLCKYLGDQ